MAATVAIQDLVLIGGGHAHVQVLKILSREALASDRLRITLISDYRVSYYSGMLPACVAKLYEPSQIEIDLAELCRWSGARFVHAKVTAHDPIHRQIHFSRASSAAESSTSASSSATSSTSVSTHSTSSTSVSSQSTTPTTPTSAASQSTTATSSSSGTATPASLAWTATRSNYSAREETISYRLCSFDVGSVSKSTHLCEGVVEHALTTRPISEFIAKIEAYEMAHRWPRRVCVVGGGVAGIELAMGFRARFAFERAQPQVRKHMRTLHEQTQVSVQVCDPADTVLPQLGYLVSRSVRRKLVALGIEVLHGARAVSITNDRVILENGHEVQTDLIVWAAGADPPPLLSRSGLPLCEAGYLLVNKHLQSVGSDRVFGAGDCITIEGCAYVTKAGVYAVREGPVLAANLLASLRGRPLESYHPQKGHLALIMSGDGEAISSWKGLAWTGSAVWKLKDKIDREFMDLFDTSKLGPAPSTHLLLADGEEEHREEETWEETS